MVNMPHNPNPPQDLSALVTTLGQQLQQIKDVEQRQVIDLAKALQQVGISEMQA